MSIKLIANYLRPAVANGTNLEARDKMGLCRVSDRNGVQQRQLGLCTLNGTPTGRLLQPTARRLQRHSSSGSLRIQQDRLPATLC
jgi:hypothetical protein